MTQVLLFFWVFSAACIVFSRKAYRVIIYFGVFSLITSVVYLALGAPDVAMSEAGISAFATIFFIVCIEQYYGRGEGLKSEAIASRRKIRVTFMKFVPAFLFTAGLFLLFVNSVPTGYAFTELRDQYLRMFMQDVGGENAVTAIYLGYRVYDTLFEALLLVIAVVAVTHVSWFSSEEVPDGQHSEIENSRMTKFTMRIICPIILLFGAYLIMNGHFTAGGGFLGGLAFASFFICRYLVLGIYDLPIKKVMKMEELVFINITILPIFAVFTGVVYLVADVTPLFQNIYLVAMSALVGMKVACGFFILFYRHIAIERLPADIDKKE
ncbi:MAG: DUF4040 domain-containing protein [Defluviitaleaceae bacterium]|nr:DUF4040 domain-containing protein [Defluviitaleaceae bacterium]